MRDNDYDDGYGDEDEEMMAEALAKQSENHFMELELAERHMNTELMDKAISVARSSWLWWFLPHGTRLKNISEIYETMRVLIDE